MYVITADMKFGQTSAATKRHAYFGTTQREVIRTQKKF